MNDSDSIIPMNECILAQGIKILSKKWIPHIFCHLLDQEVLTFTELQQSINNQFQEGITGSVLSDTLKLLEKNRMITKTVITDYIPAKTEYNLTKKGKELRLIYGLMKNWTLKWIKEEQKEGLEAKICCSLDIMPEIQQKINLIEIS